MEYAIAGIVGFVGGISGIAVYTYIKSRTPSKKKTTSNNQKLVKIEKLKDNTAKKIPNGSESPSKSSESRRKSETAQKSSPGQRKSRNRPSEATIYGIGQLQNPKSEIPEPESSRNKKADSADELTDNTLNKIRKELAQSSDLYTTGEQTVEPTAMFTTNGILFIHSSHII